LGKRLLVGMLAQPVLARGFVMGKLTAINTYRNKNAGG
jgi:hypothetical protein